MSILKTVTRIAFVSLGVLSQLAYAAGGELHLVPRQTDAHVRNFNPYNYSVGVFYAQDFIYEPLWIYNVMHPGKDFPRLATSFEVSADLKSITYSLREGVKWSDGEAFDADDVVFTFNYQGKHPSFAIGLSLKNKDNPDGLIESIEKLDSHKVRVNLSSANSLAHLAIGRLYPLPEHIWSKIDDPVTYTNPNPVATGPFTKVTHFKRSQFKVCRNPLFWEAGKPHIDCLVFPQYSSNEQTMAAFTRGKIDWLGDGVTDPKTFTGKNPNAKYWFPPDGNANLHFNTTKKPFNNVEFRKAVSVAINRRDLLEIATFGLTTETKYPIGTGEFYAAWYDPSRLKKYQYLMSHDPARAKQILDAAGFVDKDGDGFRENPDGSTIEFKLSVPSGWTDWVNSLQSISENLQDVGLNAKLHTPDENAWFDTIPNGDFDVYIMWVNLAANPWRTYFDMFNPARMKPGAIDSQAMHQMQIPAVNNALDKVALTTDSSEQKRLFAEVHEAVATNLPVVGLFANPSWYEYNDSRFEGWANAANPFIRPLVHNGIPERLIHVLNLKLKPGAQ